MLDHHRRKNIQDNKLKKQPHQKKEIFLENLNEIKNNNKHIFVNYNKLNNYINRNKSPIIAQTKRKNTIKEDKQLYLNRSQDIILNKKEKEKKEKEKKNNINNVKYLIKNKNPKQLNNIYISKISGNIKNNKKDNDKSYRAKTPVIKNKYNVRKNKSKDKQNKQKENKNNKNDNNNMKLIDIKEDDKKEFINNEDKKIENKVEIKQEIKIDKKEVKINNFQFLIDNNILMNILSSFLDDATQYNLFSCNKKLTKYLYKKLLTSLGVLKAINYINSSSDIQDRINSLRKKYKNDILNREPSIFSLSKKTIKSIELLNDKTYSKIFSQKILNPPLNKIILIYRIFFQLLNNNDICKINNDKLFWFKASKYILKHSNGKIGEFMIESINKFDFSVKNRYQMKKIIIGNEDKITTKEFSKYCETTGLVIFLIKDALEYYGILQNSKTNIPCILLKYLEYIREILNKLESYINDIKRIKKTL